MLVIESHFALLRMPEIWWPESAGAVVPLLRASPVVTVRQCDRTIAAGLSDYAFRTRPAPTSEVDLRLTQDELWRRLDSKSCRYEIRKAQELESQLRINDRDDEARALINAHLARKRYGRAISLPAWRAILSHADVFTVRHENAPFAAHVILCDPPRARLLMSATIERTDAHRARVAGRLNRLLHWHELMHYKKSGYRTYDFGGATIDPSSSFYPISQFKRSFGGEIVERHTLRLAESAALRTALRISIHARLYVIRRRDELGM